MDASCDAKTRELKKRAEDVRRAAMAEAGEKTSEME